MLSFSRYTEHCGIARQRRVLKSVKGCRHDKARFINDGLALKNRRRAAISLSGRLSDIR